MLPKLSNYPIGTKFYKGEAIICLETYPNEYDSQFTRGKVYFVDEDYFITSSLYVRNISIMKDDKGSWNGWGPRYFLKLGNRNPKLVKALYEN